MLQRQGEGKRDYGLNNVPQSEMCVHYGDLISQAENKQKKYVSLFHFLGLCGVFYVLFEMEPSWRFSTNLKKTRLLYLS